MIKKSEVFLSSGTGITQGHHRYFSSAGDALSFFRGKQVYTTDDINIVRSLPSKHGWNVSEVHFPLTLRSLENAEYLSFYNKDVSSVWFHCRILHVEYVSESSSRVQFQIDYYATYIGYCTLGYGFLERGHIPKGDDDIGKFLIQEPFNPPLVTTRVVEPALPLATETLKPDTYAFFSSSNEKGITNDPKINFRTLLGAESWGFWLYGDRVVVDTAIKTYMNQTTSMQTIVKPFMDGVLGAKYQPLSTLTESDKPLVIQDVFVDALLPSCRNKKCYSPQYLNYHLYANSTGSHLTFNVLWAFSDTIPLPVVTYKFTTILVGGLNANAITFIDGAMKEGVEDRTNYVQSAPYPSLNIASYKPAEYTNWAVFKKTILEPVGTGLITSVVSGGLGLGVAGAKALNAIGDLNGLGDSAKTYSTTSTPFPDFVKAAGFYSFQINRYSPTEHYFKVLDDFFDRWGYVVNETRKIALNVRSNFTYVKTGDCVITGKAPQIAIAEISNMLNSGCTFWQVEIGSTKLCG